MGEIIIIYNTSVRFCDILSQIGIIPECRKKIYIYGFELLLSSAIGIFSLIVLSALAGKPFAWIPYLIGFIPLRITGGGYHAKTHLTCIVSFSLAFLLLLELSNTICQIPYIHFIFSGTSLGITYFFAPVEAINKPLSSKIREKSRKRCIGISWFNIFASLAVSIAGLGDKIHITMYFAGMFSAGISMIAVFQKNYHGNNMRHKAVKENYSADLAE